MSSHCKIICRCCNQRCKDNIQAEYDRIVGCLREADKILPRTNLARKRTGGQPSLQFSATTQSTHTICGWVKDARVKVYLIKSVFSPAHLTNAPSGQRNVKPSNKNWIAFTPHRRKTTSTFWKSWKQLYNKNKRHLPPVVNSCSSKTDTANAWMENFKKNSTPNNVEWVEHLTSRF